MKINGEYLCELVRAHYDGDDARFNVILQQIIGSETRKGDSEAAGRLRSIDANHRLP